jgi:hypothetical protein
LIAFTFGEEWLVCHGFVVFCCFVLFSPADHPPGNGFGTGPNLEPTGRAVENGWKTDKSMILAGLCKAQSDDGNLPARFFGRQNLDCR